MAAAAVDYRGPTCPHCAAPLDLGRLVTGMQRCPECARAFQAVLFAAPVRPAAVRTVAGAEELAGTACPTHPGNVGSSNCQRCGVFMCSLCEIDTDDMRLCPACFDRLSAEGALASTRTTFRDYGRQAAILAVAGVPLVTMGVVIGPAAVYYAIRSLRQLRAMGETTGRARAFVAMASGVCELGFGVFFVYLMAN